MTKEPEDFGNCNRCNLPLHSDMKFPFHKECRKKVCASPACKLPDRIFYWIKFETDYCTECRDKRSSIYNNIERGSLCRNEEM